MLTFLPSFPSPQTERKQEKESVLISVSVSPQKGSREKTDRNPYFSSCFFRKKKWKKEVIRKCLFLLPFSSSFFFLGWRENEIKKKISNPLSSSPSLLEKRKKRKNTKHYFSSRSFSFTERKKRMKPIPLSRHIWHIISILIEIFWKNECCKKEE